MKTTLTLLLSVLGLGFALFAKMPALDPADLVAGAFVLALLVWTIGQYRREPRSLYATKPTHLSINPAATETHARARRAA